MTDPGNEKFPESLDPVSLERSMHMLGHIWGVNGLEVAIEPGAGASCGPTKRGGIRITLDPQQILEGNPENATTPAAIPPEVTALFIGGHELGHGRDMMDPEAVLKPRNEAEHFFECLIDDTVIDKRNRLVPLLDSYADDIYGMQMPEDLTDKPKHVQLMYGIRISEVLSNPDIPIDPQVERIITGLREYEQSGAVFDIISTMTDPRTSLKERREISQRFIWPEYQALLEQDEQEGASGGESEDGDFREEYEEYQQAVHGHRRETDPQDAQDEQSPEQSGEATDSSGNQEGNAASGDDGEEDASDEDGGEGEQGESGSEEGDPDKGGESGEDDGEGDQDGNEAGDAADSAADDVDGEALARQIAQVIQGYEELADQEAAEAAVEAAVEVMEDDENPETDETSMLTVERRAEQAEELAEIFQREMKLDKNQARDYVRSLEKWQHIIHQVAGVFMKLAAPADVVMSPRYRRRAQSEGVRLHPGTMASLAVQLASGQEQNIWQPVEQRAHRQEVTFGGLDFYFLGDSSGSMSFDGKAQASADTGLCLVEGLELARHKVARRPGQAHKPDVRTQFITFGEGAEVLSPLTYEPTAEQKGRIYADLINPEDEATYVSGALKHVIQSIRANPGRDAIVFIVGDGEFYDFDRAEELVNTLPSSVHVVQLMIGRDFEQYITSNHEAITDPAELPARLYNVLGGYIKRLSVTHEPHAKFWESTAPTVEFHR